MQFFNLDANGDWTFAQTVKDEKAINLNIKTRVLSWKNDCFFDMGAGIDWLNRLGTPGQLVPLEEEIKNIILKTDGVRSLVAFSASLVDRKLSVSYTVTTDYTKNLQGTIERAV